MHRRGVTTSEFWATLAVCAGSVTAALSGVLPPRWAALASAVSVAAFAISRGLAKGGTPSGTP